MFFFVHVEIFVGICFDGFLLVLQHGLLHGHELADCVSFEAIEQMFQSVSEVFRILVYDLGHDFSLGPSWLRYGLSHDNFFMPALLHTVVFEGLW